MSLHRVVWACAAEVFICAAFATVAAQEPIAISGQLLDALSGEPVPSATVFVEELALETTSDGEGRFSFDGIAPGTYHVYVLAEGYSSRRTEVVAGASAAPLIVAVDPELHFEEVVSVSAQARNQFESFQPTSVLAGQDLAKQVQSSLGATLENQPGVSSRSFGPAAARPVIRGLDGDRVLILEDGQRTGDVSSQSGDHGVSVNPAAAQRIEVVRGPATLLYGANAIGGLVNIISDEIPTSPVLGTRGTLTVDGGTAAAESGIAGDVHIGNGTFALHMGGSGRRAGDVYTPLGATANSQSRTGLGSVGLSWTGGRTYVGGSYGYNNSKYGVPVVEGGIIQLTPRRHAFTLRAGGQSLEGIFNEFRATVAVRRYQHDELEGNKVGTHFVNNTEEFELMLSHRPVGRLAGSVGGWFLDRTFEAQGAEALSPAINQRGVAAFLYEEIGWPHVTVQFGGRLDYTRYAPAGEPQRRFTTGSGSLGLLFRPVEADDRVVIAASLARATRVPALEELFFFGLHRGNFALELGNPALDPEQALGFDVSLRWRGPRISGEMTYFRNRISNYIFRNVLDQADFAAREESFAERFPSRALVGHDREEGGNPITGDQPAEVIVDFIGADAVLQGVELHTDVQIASRLTAQFGLDYVQGTIQASNDPLPRIPPLRFQGGLTYRHNALQMGADVTVAAAQKRISISGVETPTDGYYLAKAFVAYSVNAAGVLNTITLRAENLTNELYRSHLSLIKDLVPETGRNVRLLYTVGF
jgi:iron complex outermembrane receptor protein